MLMITPLIPARRRPAQQSSLDNAIEPETATALARFVGRLRGVRDGVDVVGIWEEAFDFSGSAALTD